MAVRVIQPNKIVNIDGKTVFLAGPIQGAPKWHEKAIEHLAKYVKDKTFTVACPKKNYQEGKFVYNLQVDWETHYLNAASKNGVIVFWLANEATKVEGRQYAQTTRFELAEWLTKASIDPSIQLMIGIENGFSGDRYIKQRAKDLHYTKTVYTDLVTLLNDLIKTI